MTVVTLRPAGITATAGTPNTPDGIVGTELRDDSDGTYVGLDVGDAISCTWDDLTLPAAATLAKQVLRLRVARDSGASNMSISPSAGAGTAAFVTWASPTTITTGAFSGASLTDAQIDALTVEFSCGAGIGVVLYESYLDVTYVVQPVVTVNAPTGTIVDSNTPEVTWTTTLDADGGAQADYEVKIFSADQYGAVGFDPATSTPYSTTGIVTSSATNVRPTAVKLANDDYRAYVRVAQAVNGARVWSDWAYSAFTIDAPLPAVPLFTLAAEPEEGRIRMDLVGAAGDVTTDLFEIQRSIDDLTWSPLRLTTDTAGVITGDVASVYDLEAGNDQSMYYRARALHDYGGVYTYSDWIVGLAAWTSTEWWLKSPQHPSLNAPIVVHSQPSYQRPARQGVFQALSARHAIVVSDTRGADRGTLVLRLDTDIEATAIDDLIDYGGVLLLQGAPGHHWRDRYVILGDLDRGRIVDKAFIEGTLDTFTWVEVDAPAGIIDDWPDHSS